MRSSSSSVDGLGGGDDLVRDLPALGDEDGEELPFAQAHELDVLEHVGLGARRHEHRRVRRQIGEHVGRFAERAVDVVAGDLIALRQLDALLLRERAHLEQRVDEEAQPLIGRHAPGRGVRLLEQARLFEIAHHVAHRGRRQVDAVAPRDRARADRLAGGEVLVNDGAEDLARAVVQIRHHAM